MPWTAPAWPSPQGNFGNVKAAALFPLFGYYAADFRANSLDLVMGSGFSIGKAFAFGYDVDWLTNQNGFDFRLGLLIRPASFLSLGLTTSIYADGTYAGGLGLAVRPLALLGDEGPRTRALSLNADLSLSESSGFGLRQHRRPGAPFRFRGSARLVRPADRVALPGDFGGYLASGTVGLEVRLSLGGTGITASAPAIASSSVAWRAAEDAEVSLSGLKARPGALPTSSIGRRVLVVKDIDAVVSTPSHGGNLLGFLSSSRTMTFPQLLALLERARLDGGVQAVAFEKLPGLDGASEYEELAAELAAVRKAGKKVYFYGDAFGMEYDVLASQADEIALNPLGGIGPLGLGFHRAYLKPIFDKLGLRFVNLAPWPTKSAYNSYTESSMPPEEEAMMKRFYGDVEDQLSLSLASGRGGKLVGGVEAAFGEAPFLTASDAFKAGLVDSLAYAPDFEDSLRKTFQGATLVSGFGASRSRAGAGPPSSVERPSSGFRVSSASARAEPARISAARPSRAGAAPEGSIGGGYSHPSGLARRSRAHERQHSARSPFGGRGRQAGRRLHGTLRGVGRLLHRRSRLVDRRRAHDRHRLHRSDRARAEYLRRAGKTGSELRWLRPRARSLLPRSGKTLDEGEIARTKAMILSIYDRFIGVVASGRRLGTRGGPQAGRREYLFRPRGPEARARGPARRPGPGQSVARGKGGRQPRVHRRPARRELAALGLGAARRGHQVEPRAERFCARIPARPAGVQACRPSRDRTRAALLSRHGGIRFLAVCFTPERESFI